MIVNAQIISRDTLAEDYFRNEVPRGHKDFPVSVSMLKQFGHCPQRWVSGYNSPESDAKDYGSLLDCRLLTPKQFDSRFAIKPATYVSDKGEEKKWNANANACKEWADKQGDKLIISRKDLNDCDDAIARLKRDDAINSFLECSDRQVWLAAQWEDDETGLVVPIKCLIDLAPRPGTEFLKCLGDLKSTRSAQVMAFQRDCYKFGYFIQGKFYADVFNALPPSENCGESPDKNTFCFIIQESIEPFQPGKRMLSEDFMTLGQAEYTRLIQSYCKCLKTGKWPGYDDTDEAVQGWSVIQAEPWMANQSQFAPKFQFEQMQEETQAEVYEGDVAT